MKQLIFITIIILSFGACKDKAPEPSSPYYFRFEADGEAFDYKYECEKGLGGFGGGCTFSASATGSATVHHFNIIGSSWANRGAKGEVVFYLRESDVLDKDTILLDGGANRVYISDLETKKYGISSYGMFPPLTGRLIILERTDNTIQGTFEFDTYKYFMNPTTLVSELSDTVLQVRNGSFLVPARFD